MLVAMGIGCSILHQCWINPFAFFSDRHGLDEKDKIEEIQKVYVDALMEYEEKKRLYGGCCFAKLLIRLSDLRSISVEHSKMLTMMKMDDSLMPNIVQDIYIQNSWWHHRYS